MAAKCPKCGKRMLRGTCKGSYHCLSCGFDFINDEKLYVDDKPVDPEPNPNNPYTEFAKEMSLLHEALKAEGFKDAMVDILAAMTPEVWKKVQFEEQKDFLYKTLGINVNDFVAKCNDDNKKPRPENWGGGAMT